MVRPSRHLVSVVVAALLTLLGLVMVAPPSASALPPAATANPNFIPTTSSNRQVVVRGAFIYWTNTWSGTIGRANLDGSGVNNSFITGLSLPSGLAVDANFIYWGANSSNSIGRANVNGTGASETFITGANGPVGVAVDANFIYWVNFTGNTVGRATISGASPNQNFITGAIGPYGIAVNASNIYWSNYNQDLGTSVGRANLNGTSPNQTFLAASAPTGLALDGTYMYWSNYTANTVGRATLAGTSINQNYMTGLDHPTGVAVDATSIYTLRVVAANFDAATVIKATLDGTAPAIVTPGTVTVASTSGAGATLTYTTPVSATDPDDTAQTLITSCAPGSLTGGTFPIGTTTVNCTSSDPIGNTSTASFSVNVTNLAPSGPPIYAGVDIISPTSLRVRWTDNTTNEWGYYVYRVTSAATLLVPGCSTSTPDLTECIDTGLTPGTYYQYYVYAWNGVGSTYPGASLVTRTTANVPLAPTVSYAYATGANSASLGWIDNATNETGYRVYLYTAGTLKLEATTAAGATTAQFTDATMSTASVQLFVVAAFNAEGETTGDTYLFSLLRTTPAGPVAAPLYAAVTNLTATTATVNWIDVATNESGYLIYRSDGVSQAVPICVALQFTPNLTSCADTGLTPGVFYQYYVYAWNGLGSGYPGTGVSVHTPKPLPAPIITDATGASNNSITLHWLDNATDETGYTVYEYAGGSYVSVATPAANATTATLTGLAPSTQHIYLVGVRRGTELTYAPFGTFATTKA